MPQAIRQAGAPLWIVLMLCFLTQAGYAQTASTTEGCSPLVVEFSGDFYWVFGDGTEGQRTDPTISYTTGTYSVEVYSDNTKSTLVSNYDITVLEKPTATLSASVSGSATPQGCVPLEVDFSYALSSNTITYTTATWVFGDGSSDSDTDLDITHTYDDPGDFNVTISLESAIEGCEINLTEPSLATAFAAPVIDFEVSPESSCTAPADITLTNNTTDALALTYLWDFGDGSTSSNESPMHTYNSEQTFTLGLTATNAQGCQSYDSVFYTVGTPQAVIDAPDTVCLDLGVTFSELTGGNATWRFNGTGIFRQNDQGVLETITSTNQESIEVFFKVPGLQEVELDLRTAGCGNDVVTKQIFVQELVIDPFTNPEYSCSNPVSVDFDVNTDAKNPGYEWLFSDNSTDNNQQVTRDYYNPSDTALFGVNMQNLDTSYIVVTQPASATRALCYDTALVDFEHYPLNAKVETTAAHVEGCEGSSFTFTDSINISSSDAITDWHWYLKDVTTGTFSTIDQGTSSTIDHLNSLTFSTSGDYEIYLDVITSSGCRDTSYAMPVTIGEELTNTEVDFESFNIDGVTNQTAFCVGDSMILSVTDSDPRIDAFHFYADSNQVFHHSTDTTVRWVLDADLGNSDVTLQVEADGCVSDITKPNYLTLNGAIPEIRFKSECGDRAETYDFTSYARSYPGSTPTVSWDFGDGTTGTSANESHDYATGSLTEYWVVLQAEDASSGCAAVRDSVKITPRQLIPSLQLKSSIACGGNEIVLDASLSEDAKDCRGYTFRFPTFENVQRPITWDYDTLEVTIPDYDEVDTTSHFFQLITTDINGCKDTVNSDTINTSFIEVGAYADTTVACLPLEMLFADTTIASNTLTNWEWIIWSGDQTQADTFAGADMDSITFTFSEAPVDVDSFFVSLQVTASDGCVGGVGDTLFILPYYELNSALRDDGSVNALCEGDTASFRGRDRNNLDLHFSWDFGNGKTDTTTNANDYTQVVYDSGGTYDVYMYYYQESTGCMDTLSRAVEVQSGPDTWFYSDYDTADVICSPALITFYDSTQVTSGSVTGYTWNFDNGETNNDQGPYTTTYQKGQYTIRMTAETSNGCSTDTSRTYNVVGPEGGIRVSDSLICPGEEITFEITDKVDVDSLIWIFGDGADTSNIDLITHQYGSAPASFQLSSSMFLYSSSGCEQAVFQNIEFYEVASQFMRTDSLGRLDSVFCIDENLFLVDQSTNADSYTWQFGNSVVSNDSKPSYAYPSSGTYRLTQVVENSTWGCVDSTSQNVYIQGFPETGIILSDDSLCLGETLNVELPNFNDSSRYVINPAFLGSIVSGSISATPDSSFTFSITETNSTGCVTSLDSQITVIQPYHFMDWDTTIQQGKTARLPIALDSLFVFVLDPLDSLSCINCNYPELSPMIDANFTLNISDIFGCFDDTYTLDVFVIPPSFISMPDSFTPNGDGINDEVFVKGWYLEELLEFRIFNRWGEEIFSTTDINDGWDGTFNGKLQISDIYVYKIRALGVDGNIVAHEGYLNLMR